MALPRPAKSKAPASVQPAGGWPTTAVSDPCCPPAGAGSFDPRIVADAPDDAMSGAAEQTMGQILNPTAH